MRASVAWLAGLGWKRKLDGVHVGKMIYSYRFRADDELRDWIEEQRLIDDLPAHLVIRRTMREAMRRQREFNRKCNEGFLAVGEGKPGPLRTQEDARGRKRA